MKAKSKRAKLLILCLMMLLVFTACSSNKDKENTESQTETTETSTETEVTEDIPEAEWVQAYKDFLNDPTNIMKFLVGEFGGTLEYNEYGINMNTVLSGISLYDFNNDDIPELMLYDEISSKINVFTFSEPDPDTGYQADYLTTLYGVKRYDKEEPANVYGYNKETGEVICYVEQYELEVPENQSDSGMKIMFQKVEILEDAFHSFVEPDFAYKETTIWENSTTDLFKGWMGGTDGNPFRKQLWSKLLVGEGKKLSENFVPFSWHPVDEMDSYISMYYERENSKSQSYTAESLFKEPRKFDFNQYLLNCKESKDYYVYEDSSKFTILYFFKNNYAKTSFNSLFEYKNVEDYDITVNAQNGYTNIRFGHGNEYGVICTVQNDERLTVSYESSDGKWCYVRYNGKAGWIDSTHVKKSTLSYNGKKEITGDLAMQYRRAFGVPDSLTNVVVLVGEPYYWEGGDCMIYNIDIYHNDVHVAGGTMTEGGEGISCFYYTPAE